MQVPPEKAKRGLHSAAGGRETRAVLLKALLLQEAYRDQRKHKATQGA